jgi:hypothetical protein
MAFLDNSGDIILDAVLTDAGRKRLAQADGSFRISKFALGDDEIDYSLYRNSNNLALGRHPSGSAYYDLTILQTPVLEAFTNNTSNMKSRLITYARNDLLYLPVIKINNKMHKTTNGNIDSSARFASANAVVPSTGYLFTADRDTTSVFGVGNLAGLILGNTDDYTNPGNALFFDQGLDSPDLSVENLGGTSIRRETQYILEVDNRVFEVTTAADNAPISATPSYIDDDNIASYYFSRQSNSGYFAPATGIPAFTTNAGDNNNRGDSMTVIGNGASTGRYGTRLGFRLKSSLDIETATSLFTLIGGSVSADYADPAGTSTSYYYLDTVVRLTGYTTGYRTEIPIRVLKKQ